MAAPVFREHIASGATMDQSRSKNKSPGREVPGPETGS
jgi:hypothetical protein